MFQKYSNWELQTILQQTIVKNHPQRVFRSVIGLTTLKSHNLLSETIVTSVTRLTALKHRTFFKEDKFAHLN